MLLKKVNIIFVSGKDVTFMLNNNERRNLISWLNDSENSNNLFIIKQESDNIETFETFTIYKSKIEYAVY
ncbi:MAG TPA: hypothetical protein VIK72_00775 [Clostridiaceae bacterium]